MIEAAVSAFEIYKRINTNQSFRLDKLRNLKNRDLLPRDSISLNLNETVKIDLRTFRMDIQYLTLLFTQVNKKHLTSKFKSLPSIFNIK